MLIHDRCKNNTSSYQLLSETSAEVKLQNAMCSARSNGSLQARSIRTLCPALEGHHSVLSVQQPLLKGQHSLLRAVEISLSVRCPSSDYLTQISWVLKCFNFWHVPVGGSCDPPREIFHNFWRVTSVEEPSLFIQKIQSQVQELLQPVNKHTFRAKGSRRGERGSWEGLFCIMNGCGPQLPDTAAWT